MISAKREFSAPGLLRHFEHHALRLQTERLEAGEQGVAVARVHEGGRMQAQEEPFVMRIERVEVAQMQRLRETPEFEQIAAPRRLREHLLRRGLLPVLVVRAQRGVIADRAPVRDREHGLKHAEDGVAAV